MKIGFDAFVLASVRTGMSKNEEVVSYIEGVEIGSGFMVSARVVGKALEPELKDHLGRSLGMVFEGVDFLDRQGRNLTIRASDCEFFVPVANQKCE